MLGALERPEIWHAQDSRSFAIAVVSLIARWDEQAYVPRAVSDGIVKAPFVFRIRVVRDADGVAESGIELHTAPDRATAGAGSQQLGIHSDAYEDYLALAGVVWHSDAQGLVSIVHDWRELRVIARAGDLYADDIFRIDAAQQTGDFELRLMRDETLVFCMLDSSDSKVANVSVRAWSVGRKFDAKREPVRAKFDPSDVEGRIVVRHAQLLRFRSRGATACEVAADLSGDRGDIVRFSLDPLPTEPVFVPVPPCAAFEVVALDTDGTPWTFADEENARLDVCSESPLSGESSARFNASGIALVQPVRCGTEYQLRSSELAGAAVTARAPERAGEILRVELRVPSTAAVLSGRLVDPDGTPRRGYHLLIIGNGLDPWNGLRASGAYGFFVDDDGRFCHAFPIDAGTSPCLCVINEDSDPRQQHLVAAIVPEEPLVVGINELGDLVLSPAPVLVSGRVLWDDGSPAWDAQLQVMRGPAPTCGGPLLVPLADQAVRIEQTDDGAFVVHGVHDARPCRLEVHHEHAVELAPIVFVPGTEELTVHLQYGREPEATFVIDADTPWRALRFALRTVEGDRSRWSRTRSQLNETHACTRWPMSPPGEYRVTVEVPGEVAPVLVIDGIEITRDGRVDHRLQDIDLRGLALRSELHFVDNEGRPVEEQVSPRPLVPKRGSRWFHGFLGGGAVELALIEPRDFTVAVRGFRTREFRAVAGRMVVRLDRLPELRLHCDVALPPGVGLGVVLHPVDPRTGLVDRSDREVTGSSHFRNGKAVCPVASSGVIELVTCVARGFRSEELAVLEPQRLDMQTLDRSVSVEVHLDRDALAAAIAKLAN